MSASTGSGTRRLMDRGDGAGSFMCLMRKLAGSLASNGSRAVAISKKMTPTA